MPQNPERRIITSKFTSSWIASVRNAERLSKDRKIREAAWAQWAIDQMTFMTGAESREYPALVLDGRFHDPKGKGPLVKPHLEIPARVFEAEDKSFPARVALAGNALAFPWWLYHEVTAVRRALFGGAGSEIADVAAALYGSRDHIAAHANAISRAVVGQWSTVEAAIFDSDDGLSSVACRSFTMQEISKVFPEAEKFGLRIDFDQRLAEKAGVWASRRVGVWHMAGNSSCESRFSIGVLTPRLTANSQFTDELFAIRSESPAALLVRTLLLRRIASECLGVDPDSCGVLLPQVTPSMQGAHLKAVTAVVGKKLPEASEKAAVGFLQAFPKASDAWAAVENWASESGVLLTVTQEGFEAAHRRAARFARRAESPDRDDINVILPIGWDSKSRVVRVMFARNPSA